jgi:hypothetical protein
VYVAFGCGKADQRAKEFTSLLKLFYKLKRVGALEFSGRFVAFVIEEIGRAR